MRISGSILLTAFLLTISWGSVAAAPGQAGHGYLGVGLADAPAGSPVAGAMVGPMDPNGPAASAGLHRGDVIRSVNGHFVTGGTALQTYVRSQPPGASLVFDVFRRGASGYSEIKITATLSSGPGSSPAANPPASPSESHSTPSTIPPVTGSVQGDLHYIQYTDPAERAFTDQVPAGWRVGGRMMRYGPLTIAPFVQAMAPDGSIFVQLGDWRIKDYADIPGWRPGQIDTPGTSIFIIRHLEGSEQYARSYSTLFAQQLGCESPSITGSQSLPPAGVATVPRSQLETHMVSFGCRRGGQHFVGRVMDTVQSYRVPGYMSWNILYLACLLARDDRAATGVAVWDKMRTSFAFNSAWNARESQIAAAAIRPAQESLDSVLRQTQAFDQNVINGAVTVNDPTTGTRSEINIGAEPFYFSDGQGHFYNSYNPDPRTGFHAVNPVH